MLLSEIVTTSDAVRTTRSRKQKVEALASLLRRLEPGEVAIAASFLSGEPRQRALGIGYAAVAAVDVPAAGSSTLRLRDVDDALASIGEDSGPGSTTRSGEALSSLFAAATAPEQQFLRGLILRNLRQGALEGIMVEALAAAAGAPATEVRRAVMLAGSLIDVAEPLLAEGPDVLADYSLELFRPIQPMLAQTAPDPSTAIAKTGESSVEAKLDGARIQVHRDGDRVEVYTRNLRRVTGSLPGIVSLVRHLPVSSIILDGESLALQDDGSPHPFQESISEFSSDSEAVGRFHLQPFFFDCLMLDGLSLIDEPASIRWDALASSVPADMVVDRIVTDDARIADAHLEKTLAAGHEGIVVKALDSPYEAGRRGATWIKVKPAHTLDLVVIAVEWGSGRREGWLSNIHLGALDPTTGEYVMLGKTFKGMTDKMLAWQTGRFLELETRRTKRTVYLKPEQVVEIAFDGILASTRYPGGMALRFARVKRYRDDKDAAEADTIDTVRTIFERSRKAVT